MERLKALEMALSIVYRAAVAVVSSNKAAWDFPGRVGNEIRASQMEAFAAEFDGK